MANQDFPTVDGDECSWADIAINCLVPGSPTFALVGAEAIKWSSKVDVGVTRGTSGGRVMNTTAGQETTDGSVSLTRKYNRILMQNLAVVAKKAGYVRGDVIVISGVRFDILIQHTPLGSVDIYTTKMSGCRYLGDGNDLKVGPDADMIEVTLNPTSILRQIDTGEWIALR